MNSESARLAVALALGERYRADQARGEARTAAEYSAQFPGYEDVVSAEYARLSATPPSAPTAAETIDGRVSRGHSAFGPPARLGPYRLERELGRGGQGSVHLAVDERLGRRVALKLLASPWSSGPDALRRFEQEARTLAALDHPGLCTVHETAVIDGVPFLAMRYVEGETLAARFAARNGLPDGSGIAAMTATVERVARAVHAAHEAGYVHRDLKPANIMVSTDGSPVVLDFGLARGESGPDLTVTGDMLGTPAYMAPEQAAGDVRAIDRRTDVHALGAVLYEAVVGARPFQGATAAAVLEAVRNAAPPDPRTANPRLSADLRTVLTTALAKNPADRYATALEFAEELRRVRLFEPIRARPISTLGRLLRWSRRRPAAAALAAVLVVLLPTLLVLGGWFVADRPLVAEQERARHAASVETAVTNAFATLRFEHGAWDRVRAALHAVLALDPANEEAHCGLARAELASGRGAEGLARLRAFAATRTTSLLVRRTEIELLRGLKHKEEADSLSVDLVPPSSAIECYFEGLRRFLGGYGAGAETFDERELTETTIWFQKAMERSPTFRPMYLDALAHAVGGLRDVALAQRIAETARLQIPGRNGVLAAGFALRSADPAAALAEFAKVSTDVAPWVELTRAGALLDLGRKEEALAAMRRYAAARADDATAQMNLAQFESEIGEPAAAESAARKAAALRPDLAVAHRTLAEAQSRGGAAPEQYVAPLREAVRLDPGNPDGRIMLAAALRKLGQVHESIKEAAEAVRLAPNRTGARVELGRCWMPQDAAVALPEFERALAAEPSNADFAVLAAVAAWNARQADTSKRYADLADKLSAAEPHRRMQAVSRDALNDLRKRFDLFAPEDLDVP